MFRKPEISGTIFRKISGTIFRNVPEFRNSGTTFRKFPFYGKKNRSGIPVFKNLFHNGNGKNIYILPPVQPTLRNKSDFGENNFFYFFLTKIHGFNQIIWKESMILFKSLLQSGSLKKMFFFIKIIFKCKFLHRFLNSKGIHF